MFRLLSSVVWYLSMLIGAQEYFRDACPPQATIKLATRMPTNENSSLDIANFPQESTWSSGEATYGCICDVKPCLSLCCPPGQSVNEAGCSDDPNVSSIPLPESRRMDHFFILYGNPCRRIHGYLLDPEYIEEERHYLLENGSLHLPLHNLTPIIDVRDYCLYIHANDTGYTPRVCSESNIDRSRVAPFIGTLISVPFLIVTFLVYLVLPELRNLHGLTLRCYVGCLATGYIFVSIDRLSPPDQFSMPICQFFGYTIHFFFLASFFWLNVMCFDIWWNFRGFGSIRVGNDKFDSGKFLYYSIYAWGLPIVVTGFCMLLDFVPEISSLLVRPLVGVDGCSFESKEAEALYFYGPLGVTLFINVLFFLATMTHLMKQETDVRNCLDSVSGKRHRDNKQWYTLYLRLFVVMGVNWTTELLSWLWTGPKYVWYFTDMVNALQGILIFVMLVWKDKIKRSIVKRIREACGGKCSEVSYRDARHPASQQHRRSDVSSKSRFSLTSTISTRSSVLGPISRQESAH